MHTISLFIKSYLDKGNQAVSKLAEVLAIFFKVLLGLHAQRKVINKALIVYNLRMDEFIKRSAAVSIAVLKYTKESKKLRWTYPTDPELGPQEFFLLYLCTKEDLLPCLEKLISTCDFF